jgi:hypothetical protein
MRNERLAQQCNIVSGTKCCPYTYCMLNFREFYDTYKNVEFEHDEDALTFLSTSRKLHKYAIMCFAYSQKAYGRENDFLERWYLERKTAPSAASIKVIKWFARKYDDFINYLFPGLNADRHSFRVSRTCCYGNWAYVDSKP